MAETSPAPVVERRRPGRPRRIDAVPRPKPRHVRLDADDDNALCRLSIRHGLSVHALLKIAVKRLVAGARGDLVGPPGL